MDYTACGPSLLKLFLNTPPQVNSLIDKINRGKVNLRPAYQREYVWTTRTASRLIESLLLNVRAPPRAAPRTGADGAQVPVPTMFFHETERGTMEVVDGKQRLTSIWAFLMGEFPDGACGSRRHS